jgi:hypothetical protein
MLIKISLITCLQSVTLYIWRLPKFLKRTKKFICVSDHKFEKTLTTIGATGFAPTALAKSKAIFLDLCVRLFILSTLTSIGAAVSARKTFA